jgi:molybdopterin-biosynthesis enzyme MoeA-like protein
MSRYLVVPAAVIASLVSFAASAAPGQYWEVTTKMEMPGMPFEMPPTTHKVCMARGAEKNPEKTTSDKDCKMTDIKTVGNKTTWKARCNRDGDITTGVGEQTNSARSYRGTIRLSSKGMTTTMRISGKRLGGKCDTGE